MSYTTDTNTLSTIANSYRQKYDLDNAKVFEAAKNKTQYMSLLMKLARVPTTARVFKTNTVTPSYIAPRFYARSADSWSGATAGSTADTVTISSSATGTAVAPGYVVPRMTVRIIHQAGGETFAIVDAVNSGTSIELTCISASPTAIADGDKIQVVSEAAGETSAAGLAATSILDPQTFYCEDMENYIAMSDVAQYETIFGPNEWQRQLSEALDQHKAKMDRAFLLSKGGQTTVTLDGASQTVTTTNGLLQFLLDNTSSLANGAGPFAANYNSYTFDQWMDHMTDLFAVNTPPSKLGIAGAGPLAHFSKINSGAFLGGANVNVEKNADLFGMKVTRISSTFGEVVLVWDKNLGGTGYYKDYLLYADMDYLQYRPFVSQGKSLDTHLMMNLTNPNDFRVSKAGYRTVAALQAVQPGNHGLSIFA